MAGDFGIVSRDGIEQSILQYLSEVTLWLLCVRACVRACVRVCVCCPSAQILTDQSSAGQTLRIGDNLLSATHFIRPPTHPMHRPNGKPTRSIVAWESRETIAKSNDQKNILKKKNTHNYADLSQVV